MDILNQPVLVLWMFGCFCHTSMAWPIYAEGVLWHLGPVALGYSSSDTVTPNSSKS